MPDKKHHAQPAPEEKELIDRVDAMMDIKRTDSAPLISPESSVPPIDIFKDLQTSPPISADEPKLEAVEAEPAPEPEPQQNTEPEVELTPNLMPIPATQDQSAATSAPDDELDDEKTDQAIDDIILAESDELLAAEDTVNKTAPLLPANKKGLLGKLFN